MSGPSTQDHRASDPPVVRGGGPLGVAGRAAGNPLPHLAIAVVVIGASLIAVLSIFF